MANDYITTIVNGATVISLPVAPTVITPSRSYTQIGFRKLLTINEQIIIDNFDITEFANSNPKITALTVAQRASVRTAIATYRDAQNINLDDADTVRLVQTFDTLGIWDSPARAIQILAGTAP